jgi:hypothetical protein
VRDEKRCKRREKLLVGHKPAQGVVLHKVEQTIRLRGAREVEALQTGEAEARRSTGVLRSTLLADHAGTVTFMAVPLPEVSLGTRRRVAAAIPRGRIVLVEPPPIHLIRGRGLTRGRLGLLVFVPKP